MALIVCPECQAQMSDAAACPKCGWARAALQSAEEARKAAELKAAAHADGAKLVRTSTWLLAIGGALIVGGCGLTVALRAGPLPALAGGSLGFALLVVSAVVGQIGRAKQGRII
jgi:hypothetical protein